MAVSVSDREWSRMSFEEKHQYIMDNLEERIAHWEDVHENGCSDPFWSDGVNLNLIRNHIIYYLNMLVDLKREPRQLTLLDTVETIQVSDNPEFDPRVPPIMDSNFMAKDRKMLRGV